MVMLYLVNEFEPISSDVIGPHWYERIISKYAAQGYEIKNVQKLEDLKKGDAYLDANGKLQTK